MKNDGLALPTHNAQLTQRECQQLKTYRRKAKNKVSAKKSRNQHKYYVKGLEARVEQQQDRITTLESENRALRAHLRTLAGHACMPMPAALYPQDPPKRHCRY